MSHSPNHLNPAQTGAEHIPTPEEFDAAEELAQRTHLIEAGHDTETGEAKYVAYNQYGQALTGEDAQAARAAHAIANPNRWLMQDGDSVEARVEAEMQQKHGHKRIQSIGMGMLRAAAEAEIAPVFERQATLDSHIRGKQAAEARRAQGIADHKKAQADGAKLHGASTPAAEAAYDRTMAEGAAEVEALKGVGRHYARQQLKQRAREAADAARTARVEYIQANGGADAIESIEAAEAAAAKKEAFLRKMHGADYERRMLQRPDGVSATQWLKASLQERQQLIADATGQPAPQAAPQPAVQPKVQPITTVSPVRADALNEDTIQLPQVRPAAPEGFKLKAGERITYPGQSRETLDETTVKFLKLVAKNNEYMRQHGEAALAQMSPRERAEQGKHIDILGLNADERKEYNELVASLDGGIAEDERKRSDILIERHGWGGAMARATEGGTALSNADVRLLERMMVPNPNSHNNKRWYQEALTRSNDALMHRNRPQMPRMWIRQEDGSLIPDLPANADANTELSARYVSRHGDALVAQYAAPQQAKQSRRSRRAESAAASGPTPKQPEAPQSPADNSDIVPGMRPDNAQQPERRRVRRANPGRVALSGMRRAVQFLKPDGSSYSQRLGNIDARMATIQRGNRENGDQS